MPCLDENQLLDLVEGRLSEEEEAAAKLHVDECDDCRELLAATAKSMFSGASDDSGCPDDTARLSRGNNVGRYVVLDVIGAGGMGVVYAAYDPELDRKVALKLLRRDLVRGPNGTEPGTRKKDASLGELQKRLLREAQAMAKLSHPNVVTVFDAGTTQGRVFLTMEFVQGMSLTEWLAAQPRTWREVLEVYGLAGRGLGAAHQAGLVHRDFKPDNVLVAEGGQVRVTDFGLARAIDRPDPPRASSTRLPIDKHQAEVTALTRPGALAGTPAYMAPEQFLGHPADHSTDQFNFAVALYEGLYRERPFAGKTLEQLEEEVIAGRVKPAPKDSEVPARVRRVLLRGMSTKREDRYPSMDEMLAAIAVGSWKIRRRILIPVAIFGIVAAGLLGYRARHEQSLVCTGAERKLEGVWDADRKREVERAFRETGKPYAADAWKGTERILDGYAAAWVKMHTEACEATHFRREQSEELLDLRVECLDVHLRQTAALTKLFANADSEVVERAVEASQSLPRLNECANATALKSSMLPPKDAATARIVQATRLTLERVKALEKSGKYAEALAQAEPALSDARRVGYLPLEAEALHQVGRAAGRMENGKRAEAALHEAADAAVASGHHEVAAHAWIDLMYFIGNKEAKYEAALQWNRFAEVAIERLGDKDGEIEADRLETVSIIFWKLSRNDEALAALQRALALYQKRLGPDHISVARALDGIATAYMDQGKLEDGYDLDRQALAIAEKALGANHPSLTIFLNNMGNGLLFVGRYEEAVVMLRRALDIAEKTLGRDHPGTIAPLDTLGEVLTSLGQYDEAVVNFGRAKEILEKTGRKDNPDYATVLSDLAEVARLRGNATESIALNREAMAILEKVLTPEHPEVGMCLYRIGRSTLLLGQAKEAATLHDRALAIVTKGTGDDSLYAATVLTGLGEARVATGEAPKAVGVLERALSLREKRPGDPRDLADVKFALAQALWGPQTDRGRALKLAREARTTFASAEHFAPRLTAVDAWLAARKAK